MTWVYNRNKKQVITLNGYYDPFDDLTFSESIWESTRMSPTGGDPVVSDEIVAAPSLSNKYAIHLEVESSNLVTGEWIVGKNAFRNASNLGFFARNNPLKYVVRSEFRMYVVEDEPQTTQYANCCAGWWLDGNVRLGSANTKERCFVGFNISNGKIAIASSAYQESRHLDTLTSVDWSGAYNTWYDIRIDMEYNWYTDPDNVVITVWVDQDEKISYDFDRSDWRSTIVSQNVLRGNQGILGRNGPGMCTKNRGGATVPNVVDAYWTDIMVTQDFNSLSWEYEDGIIQKGKLSVAKGRCLPVDPTTITEGSDIQIWARNNLTETFTGQFRGILRSVNSPRKRFAYWIAEGYQSVLYQEKTDVLSFTTQTTGTILAAAVNNPTKSEFDTTDYFDVTTTTYTREYINAPKMAIIEEMAALEGFLVFLDNGNNWHFQSYRTNETSKHLIYGESLIRKYSLGQDFVRTPNILKVVGNGVSASREITSNITSSNTNVMKVIDRTDLATQAEVDAALDYYVSIELAPLRTLSIEMRVDYAITKGNLIRVTIPDINIHDTQFTVTQIKASYAKPIMKLSLLEASPNVTTIVSDLSKQTDNIQAGLYTQDGAGTEEKFHVEGLAVVFIEAEYEIEFSSTVERSGKMIVTNDFIDDLLAVMNEETIDDPTHIAIGTGTTNPKFADTTLETESSRAVASAAYAEDMGGHGSVSQPRDISYRAVAFAIDIVDPSGVTELGILNAASSGTLACRAVFDSYSKTGTVTFRIRFRTNPSIGTAQFSTWGLYKLINWIRTGTNWTYVTYFLFGVDAYFSTHPDFGRADDSIGGYGRIPYPMSKGTLTLTKFNERNRLKLQFDYDPFLYADMEGYGWAFPEYMIAVQVDDPARTGIWSNELAFGMFRRQSNLMSAYEDHECKWILWLEIRQRGYLET